MRVASKSIYEGVQKDLGTLAKDIFDANKVVASGRRINHPSDDPVGSMQALSVKSSLANMAQLERNITMGTVWLNAGEAALGHAQELITEARALATQMATATVNSDQRQAAAGQVQNLLEEMVSLGNTQVNGEFIFSGTRTDVAPFEGDGSYHGNDSPFSIKVGNTSTIEVGADGADLFDTVFTSLVDLKAALENNEVEGITAAMDALGKNAEHLSARQSEIGSKALRMEMKSEILQDLQISGSERLSAIEDADMAEAITRLMSKELAYKAALATSSRVMSLSLVDFVR